MPRLGIAKEFLAGYARLQKPVQKAVDAAIGKFAEHTHAGLHLEKLAKARDPRIRTIRVNQFYRGVVLTSECGNDYLLLTVLPHDDAIAYAVSHRFTVNQALGVLEVRNQDRLDELAGSLAKESAATGANLFQDVGDADLARLGIEASLIPLVRVISTEVQLVALAGLLPEAQHDVLTGLAAGMTPEEVWNEVGALLSTPGPVNADDLLTAAQHAPDRFAFVSGPDELAFILRHPFDAWRVFLHPAQRAIAHETRFSGPALVTGGAGTGKTVTVLHRAVFLARRHPNAKVLLTTFTRNLAEALESQLASLCREPEVASRIEILNVDRLAHRVVAQARGRQPRLADPKTLRSHWDRAATGTGLTGTFLEREWEQVLLVQRLYSLDDYLAAQRRGRGTTLSRAQREQAWKAIQQVISTLAETGQSTHLQLAEEATDILTLSGPLCSHVIVDEGQDLHPAQWRLLRAAVPEGGNDLFIVADPHQRIYDNHVSLARLGIQVRGRSRKLRVNYRTTHEILTWSSNLLGGMKPAGLDDLDDSLSGYRSVTHGRPPIVRTHRDRTTEVADLAREIIGWLDNGVEPSAIGVAARNTHLVRTISDGLSMAGIATGPVTNAANVVRVGTMHSMKGLEFRCLAVIGVEASAIPASAAVTDEQEDPLAHQQDLQRERCLLYVACTRARDLLYVSHTGRPSSFLTSPG